MKKQMRQRTLYILVFLLIVQVSCSLGTPETDSVSPVIEPTTSEAAPMVEEAAPQNNAPPHGSDDVWQPSTGEGVLFYNLPQATLTESTGLFASPNRPEYVVNIIVPAGEIVYVMGRNSTASHLRVVWNTGVGWVPVSFTDYNANRERIKSLPVFQRDPPPCAVPLTTQFSLNSEWTSENSQRQRIAVVVDLFRTRYGDFPTSYLSLTVNGTAIEESKRQIVERGQFTLKDVVFTLPDYIYPNDVIGYLLETNSDEELAFMATLFDIPEGCVWDTN